MRLQRSVQRLFARRQSRLYQTRSYAARPSSVLQGKRALIVGVADDRGYGWAIAKSLAEAGATVTVATWVPAHALFVKMLERGKLDASRSLSGSGNLDFQGIYPVDVAYDTRADVPAEVLASPKYRHVAAEHDISVQGLADAVVRDHGGVDILVHAVANAPEVASPLLETSRAGYQAALDSSAYSMVSLLQHLGPHMPLGAAALSLTYEGSRRVVPGYGGGMSSAKAALESDTRTLAFEAGEQWGVRINCICAPPLPSRAARSIGNIDAMRTATAAVAPLQRDFDATDVGNAAAFLCSDAAAGITGVTIPVDNGAHLAAAGVGHNARGAR